jgi:hypothetical protein
MEGSQQVRWIEGSTPIRSRIHLATDGVSMAVAAARLEAGGAPNLWTRHQ